MVVQCCIRTYEIIQPNANKNNVASFPGSPLAPTQDKNGLGTRLKIMYKGVNTQLAMESVWWTDLCCTTRRNTLHRLQHYTWKENTAW